MDQSKFRRKPWIMGAIRKSSYRYPPRYIAKLESRKERGKYECSQCKELFGPKQIQLDHIQPVVDPQKGFTDWNDYVERMFPDFGGFQVVCKACHKAKTLGENKERRKVKKEKKKV
jgi:hypothetical protein